MKGHREVFDIWYTPKHCNASASITLIIYFNIGTNASNPIPANVFAIRQNTPIGATFIIAIVISIITSLNWLKKLATVDALFPSLASMIPTNNANTITGNISPVASDSNIFFGIIFNNVSAKLIEAVADVVVPSVTVISIPTPGLISDATPSARLIASAVVRI